MTDRPYFNCGIEQLEAVSASMWNDVDGLVTLSVELGHRATQRAGDLRARVIRRIFELEHGIAPTHRAQAPKPDDGANGGKQDPPAQQSTSAHHEAASEPPQQHADSQGPVGRAISDVRRKLLDLTGRSRLLNYRFTKRSLRVVGELPNLLFDRLTDGQSMMFIPIPEPPRRWDEGQDTELVPTAESPNSTDGPHGASGTPSSDGKRKSTWGSKRKRKRHLPPVEQEAQRLGLSTEYDLPITATPTGELDARLTDNRIQTLYYPDDLEAVAGKIYSDARLVEQETGANLLQLSFGMLEWFESEDEEKPYRAPLLLLPVDLKKGSLDKQTGTFKYEIAGRDEDPMVNVSLQEKLRQEFGVELPDLGDDESCASYLQRTVTAVAGKRRWAVRGYVTLGLLQFGKILMYRDLDATSWPKDRGPDDHPLLQGLFQGGIGSEAYAAQDYAIDEYAPAALPPLILNADSSQHSALIDALQGQNLVIEGPPGTGKSQTITNLIAAAISQGKRVLFIAEKAAALQVVHKRLADARFRSTNGEQASLADFVLELHSHKTKKREVLDSLDRRLILHGHLKVTEDFTSLDQALSAQRQLLIDYAKLMASPYGNAGLTLHDILWGVPRWREEVGDGIGALDGIDLPNAVLLSKQDLERDRLRVEQHRANADAAARVGGTITDHPWCGVEGDGLGVSDVAPIQATTDRLRRAADELESALRELEHDLPWLQLRSRDDIGTMRSGVTALEPRNDVHIDLLLALRDPAAARAVGAFMVRLQALHDKTITTSNTFGTSPSLSADVITDVRDGLARLATVTPTTKSSAAAASLAARLNVVAAECRRVSDHTRSMGGIIEDWAEPTIAHALQLEIIASALNGTPSAVVVHRHEGLKAGMARETLGIAREKLSRFSESRSALEHAIRLELIPGETVLADSLAVCNEIRWWSILSARYRRTRSAHRTLSLVAKPTRAQMVEDYRNLATLMARRREAIEVSGFRDVSGPFWREVETPVSELISAVECWQRLVRCAVEQPTIVPPKLVNELWATTPAQLSVAIERAAPTTDVLMAGQLRAALKQLHRDLPALEGNRATELPLSELADLLDHQASLLLAAKQLIDSATLDSKWEVAVVGEFADRCMELRAEEGALNAAQDAAAILGGHFNGFQTSLDVLTSTIGYIGALRTSPLPPAGVDYLWHGQLRERWSHLRARMDDLVRIAATMSAAEREFEVAGGISGPKWYQDTSTPVSRRVIDIAERARRALAASEELVGWLDYRMSWRRLADSGLASLALLVELGAVPTTRLPAAYEYLAYRAIAAAAFREYPALDKFTGTDRDAIRHRFRELDEKVILLARVKLAVLAAYATDIPFGNGTGPVATYTERSLIQHEMGKKKRHIALRQLLSRSGKAIQALKPCFMMSPLSVAQYLAPGRIEFDLVVIDEASQVRPEDALGVIARAKQIVVVGDQKQLPPTNFFAAVGEDIEESEAADDLAAGLKETESILEFASRRYTPSRMLRWHYRSRHGSLIAFSNQQFYNGRLVVFPSPQAAGEHLGVSFVHVPTGIWDGETNHVEAETVADAVLRHMETRPERSLGVATMNATQRDLIQAEVELRIKDSPLAQGYIQRWDSEIEDFFVKNLENVQGDERDVIFVSITYGPKAPGQPPHQHWGPINGASGARRLNVLFTRAKHQVVVFSSITSGQVIVSESSSEGVQVLRAYLDYAETGRLSGLTFTGRAPDSDFEISVARALLAAGFEVVPQLGVAGYFLDLAVKDPDRPGSFLAGIECDGAAYHSSKSARDRDRLRQLILEDLGWHIHRIWSTEWFKHGQRETSRLIASLRERQALLNSRA